MSHVTGLTVWLPVGIGVLLVMFVPFFILAFLTKKPKEINFANKHVLVTGGSQGIGLEVAKQCAKKGSHISIIARNVDQLRIAQEQIEKCRKYPDSQMIQAVSCDLASSYDAVEKAIRQAESVFDSTVDVLINAAGYSKNTYFEDFSIPQFRAMMDVNYFGALYATKAVLDNMKVAKSGTIAFLSSQGAQVGFIGMCCYSPTKYALKGLAECLHNELLPFGINIAVVYPPDTDTPGFATENMDKSVECRAIAATSSLAQPDAVAKHILSDLELGRFSIAVGLDGLMLNALTSGMLPYESFFQAFVQVYLVGLFRLIAMFYAIFFQGIVMKHRDKRNLYNCSKKRL